MAQQPINVYKDKLDVFYGGISEDIRIQKPDLFRIAQHFDIYTNPKRLVAYRAMEADDTNATAYKIVLFNYINSKLYGLGIVSGGTKVKLFNKVSDPIVDNWTETHPTNAEDSAGARSAVVFKGFHDYIYGLTAGTRIWACGPLSGSVGFTATALSLSSYTNTCQGFITNDDKYLQPYDNKIAVKDGAGSGPTTNWTLAGLTIPDYLIVTDVAEWGDKVAVACRPKTGVGNSKVAIWDKTSTDPDQWIDWGEGDLYILENMEGELRGVSQIGGTSFVIRGKIVIRKWSGGSKALIDLEIESDDTTCQVYGNHVKALDGNRLIFGIKMTLDGVSINQLAAYGRKKEGYPYALTFDRLVDNDSAITSIDGLYKLGNYHFVAHNSDGSINRPNDQAVYTGVTATLITQKLNGERQLRDSARKRKVLAYAGLLTKAMTSGQSCSLYYRTDGNTSWTLIRTYTYGDDTTSLLKPIDVGFENGIESDGSPFQNMKEWQFKVTTATGVEITGIDYGWKLLDADSSE